MSSDAKHVADPTQTANASYVATDVPDAESLAHEVARLTGVVKDLLGHLKYRGVIHEVQIEALERRLAGKE